ncbi:hypothetical protein B296_00032746 [Ensete ventricosum]|uniref:RRM domain-containing protein n=1 Tax=Ensete ventricosum TaxID=4639 RepID=A0A426YDT8_ENSVE|nr:hypothetical protein B296_00032746 [Ensete ventricosum]
MTRSRSLRCNRGLSTWELAIGSRKYLLRSSVPPVSNPHKDHINKHPAGIWAERRPIRVDLAFSSYKMRPIFCGNFEYDARQSELERLFSRYGKVDRVDMKSGKSIYL